MGLLHGTRRALLGGRRAYTQKVLSYNPLVYFPQWENAGVVSDELINGWNGAYTGVTLGQPGIGDGNTSPFFDGLLDFNNIWTAALRAAFNGNEGTVAIWGRVNAVGVWTDAAWRYLLAMQVDVNNRLYLAKSIVNNTLQWQYRAAGVIETVALAGLTTTDWFYMALTWSGPLLLNEVRAYYNGVQTGLTQVGLGAWAGLLHANRNAIGAFDIVPTSVSHGWAAHGAVWARPLAPAEIADLYVI